VACVLCFQALEGVEVGSDEEEGPGDGAAVPKQPVAHSYAAEQQELKKAFLQAAAEAEEGADDGVLQKKAGKRSAAEAEDAGQDKEQQVNKVSTVEAHPPPPSVCACLVLPCPGQRRRITQAADLASLHGCMSWADCSSASE